MQEIHLDGVKSLYIQLMYACNFACKHCFHGDNLKSRARISLEDLRRVIRHFRAKGGLQECVFLGGEPFLYPDLQEALDSARELGIGTVVCTNGHRFTHSKILANASRIGFLRVSVDGLASTHDYIRSLGSFDDACTAIRTAAGAGIKVGVTLTVMSGNVAEIPTLASTVADLGATELKLHQLRRVGNAAGHPELSIPYGDPRLARLLTWIDSGSAPLRVKYDADLVAPETAPAPPLLEFGRVASDRIEMSPNLDITVSCKAVGTGREAFYWDTDASSVLRKPGHSDELSAGVPQVVYIEQEPVWRSSC